MLPTEWTDAKDENTCRGDGPPDSRAKSTPFPESSSAAERSIPLESKHTFQARTQVPTPPDRQRTAQACDKCRERKTKASPSYALCSDIELTTILSARVIILFAAVAQPADLSANIHLANHARGDLRRRDHEPYRLLTYTLPQKRTTVFQPDKNPSAFKDIPKNLCPHSSTLGLLSGAGTQTVFTTGHPYPIPVTAFLNFPRFL